MPIFCEACARLRRAQTCTDCGGLTFEAPIASAREVLEDRLARGTATVGQRLDALLLRLGTNGPEVHTAGRALAKMVQQSPDNGRVQLLLGLACYRAGNLVGAIRATALALRLEPRRYNPPLDPADLMVAKLARVRLEHLESQPPAAETALELGRLRAFSGDYAGALDTYLSALPERSNDIELLASMGLAMRLVGQPREAVEVYEQILEHTPNFPMAHNNLVASLADLGEVQRAEAAAAAAVRLDPRMGSAMISLGTLYLEVGRHNEAISALWEAETRDPELLPTAAILRAAAWLLEENTDKAQDEIDLASEHPKIHTTPQIGYVRATALERRERDAEAAAAMAGLWEMAVG